MQNYTLEIVPLIWSALSRPSLQKKVKERSLIKHHQITLHRGGGTVELHVFSKCSETSMGKATDSNVLPSGICKRFVASLRRHNGRALIYQTESQGFEPSWAGHAIRFQYVCEPPEPISSTVSVYEVSSECLSCSCACLGRWITQCC